MGGNRFRIVITASLFNLLFEYSLRGLNNLKVQPFLPFILFPIYFSLFTLVEDLIVRWRLRDIQLMLLSFIYGTIYLAFISGILFLPPLYLGINWGALFYINLVWWGALQSILTFYLANLIERRDWNHPRMSMMGWAICLGIQAEPSRYFKVVVLFLKARHKENSCWC